MAAAAVFFRLPARLMFLAAGFLRVDRFAVAVFLRVALRLTFLAAEARAARFVAFFRFFFFAIVLPPLALSGRGQSPRGIH
ncbi:MAG: hypothetical protein AABY90_02765, partial [Nitrospirota bacterium]